MSTKIYNGFLFDRPHSSIDWQVDGWLSDFQRKAIRMATRLYHQAVVSLAYQKYDDVKFCKVRNLNPPVTQAYQELRSDLALVDKGARNPPIDWSVSLSLFVAGVGEASTASTVAGIYFIENPTLVNLLKRQPWFFNYPYWDNADPPSNITYAGWKIRGKFWEEALGETGRPEVRGYNRTIVNPELDILLHPVPQTAFRTMAPGLEIRARRLAEGRFCTKHWLYGMRPQVLETVLRMKKEGTPENKELQALCKTFLARLKNAPEVTYGDLIGS